MVIDTTTRQAPRGPITRELLTSALGALKLVDGTHHLQHHMFSPQFLAWTLGINSQGAPNLTKDVL